MTDETNTPETNTAPDGALIHPGSTATGSGTGLGEESETDLADVGTTEADVSDGREQKQQPID